MWRADGDFGGEGGSGLWDVLLNHPGLIAIITIVMLVLVLVASVAAWVAARRLRHSGRVGRRLLQLKAQALPPGSARELASMRLSLGRATEYTANCVTLASRAGRPVGDLPGLTHRLTTVSSALDRELALLEGEPDPHRLRSVLPAARARLDATIAAATRIRDSLGQLEAAEGTGELTSLTADVATEVAALQAGVASLRGLGNARD